MSILSSTNSGINQPITYDYLVQQGYLVSETHAIKICNNGAKYELSKYNGDTVYKAHIIGEFIKNFTISYYVQSSYACSASSAEGYLGDDSIS